MFHDPRPILFANVTGRRRATGRRIVPAGDRAFTGAIAAARVVITIEVPRGSFFKRDGGGVLEFVSPLPCPFNYGSVAGRVGGDDDLLDAVVLGPRLARGTRVALPVRGAVGFTDAGAEDLKLVCSRSPLAAADRRGVLRFFRFYAGCKRLLNAFHGRSGPTACHGWQPWSGPGQGGDWDEGLYL